MDTMTVNNPVVNPLDALWSLFKSQPKNVRKAFAERLLAEDVEAAAMRQRLVVRQSLGQAFKEFSDAELTHLFHAFTWIMDDVREGNFTPNIIYEGEKPVEFASVPLTMMEGGNYKTVNFSSIS